MSTIRKEGKVKLMSARGDLDYVAETLDISISEAEALRTYNQYVIDGDSPIAKMVNASVLEGVQKAQKAISKSSQSEDDKAQLTQSLAEYAGMVKLENVFVSCQNKAIIMLRNIPRMNAVIKPAGGAEVVSCDDI